MQASLQKINDIDHKLTISVPEAKLKAAYQTKMHEIAQKTNINGYRPGSKALMQVLETRHANDIQKEALGDVIQQSLTEALKEHQLMPVSTPEIDPKPFIQNAPFEFTASFEVLPDYKNIRCELKGIQKPVVEISETDIQEVIDQILKQHAEWQLVDRAAEEKDRVIMDYEGMVEGDAQPHTTKHATYEFGKQAMLPGFEEALLGIKAGETRTFTLTFPTDWHDATQAGKKTTFTVLAKEIYAPKLPTLDAAFIKQLRIESGELKDLQQEIEQSLKRECERLTEAKLKEQVFTNLLEQNAITVPPALIKREAARIHQEMHRDHHDHAHDEACSHVTDEKEAEKLQEAARKRVSLGVLIACYAKEAGLKVDEMRLAKRVTTLASSYEKPAEMIQWLLSNKEYRMNLESQVLEEMIIEKLLEQASVEEKKMSFSELKSSF